MSEFNRYEELTIICETDEEVLDVMTAVDGVDLQQEQEVLDLLLRCEDGDYIIDLTFDELNKIPFTLAKKIIFKFSMVKRLQMLEAAKIKRNYLGKMISYYGMEEPPIKIMPKEYMIMMSKLKHVEILIGWLYGIE